MGEQTLEMEFLDNANKKKRNRVPRRTRQPAQLMHTRVRKSEKSNKGRVGGNLSPRTKNQGLGGEKTHETEIMGGEGT